MTDAQKILRRIETVDPADTAKLDEIDSRVIDFIGKHEKHTDRHDNVFYLPIGWEKKVSAAYAGRGEAFDREDYLANFDGLSLRLYDWTRHMYTRSRDALKAIRPEGWTVDTNWFSDGVESLAMNGEMDCPVIASGHLPTEELAELHAIIQAIAFERAKV